MKNALCKPSFLNLRIGSVFALISLILSTGYLWGAEGNDKKCIAPPSGLVSWWPGDGNSHDIVGPNNGQLYGGATFADGLIAKSFRFDGVGAYFQSSAFQLPSGNSDRTLEMWVKVDSVLPVDVPAAVYFEAFFAGYGGFGSLGGAFELFSEHQPPYGDALAWSQWGDQLAGPLLSPATHPDNAWHHVAVTVVAPSNVGVVLFLDGVPVARRDGFLIDTLPATMFYMGRIPGPLGDERRMHGQLDEVSVYNRVLAPQEIAAIFNAGKAGKCKPN